MDVKAIINPVSGQGKAKATGLESNLRKAFNGKDLKNVIENTSLDKDKGATVLAEKAADEGFDTLLACGGDGTINEVINGIAHLPNPRLGIIPIGTVNVLAKEMKIRESTSFAIKQFLEGKEVKMDLGKAIFSKPLEKNVNHRYFALMAGVGFDALVASKVSVAGKHWLKQYSYILEGIKTVFSYTFPKLNVNFIAEGEEEEQTVEAYIVIITNVKRYGGNFIISKDALTNDGLLDLVVYKKKGKVDLLKFVYHLFKGTHYTLPGVEIHKVSNVKVESTGEEVLFHLDGEPVGPVPVEVRVEKEKLTLIK